MASVYTATDPLRPTSLETFTGQDDVVKELGIILGAARQRETIPPHVLLSGPPGLGKTTLAAIIASTMDLPLVSASAPALEKPGDLASLLVSLNGPSVVFVDEVHQLPKVVEETLYSAMEDGRIDVIISDGATNTRSIPMPLEPFTLVGATTSSGSLGGPFRDRFGYLGRLVPYSTEVLAGIVSHNAETIGLDLTGRAAEIIADRSRGTPRIANRLLRRVHDWATSHGVEQVDESSALAALDTFGVDGKGLGRVDRELLRGLCEHFNGGPVGLGTLAAAVGESEETVAREHEPFLMRSGLIARTPRGRVATVAAWEHLGLPVPTHVLAPG